MSDNEARTRLGNPRNFIEEIIEADIAAGKNGGRVATRFPPEPNGYLHIGHAKSICLNFGLAQKYGGTCNLRYDDTNPETEESEFVESIQEDVRWLGFAWDNLCFASDYFERMYELAMELVKQGKAYVEELTPEEIREYRGDFNRPGRNSPYRDRPIEENVALFEKMRAGGFPDGAVCLRAKIDMQSPNMNLRDPIMYRVRHVPHHRTKDAWCIYPMYDWAHGLEDAIEGITHSICTLEFENHRPLYDWFLEQLPVHRPQQIEFARLNLSYTVMSKRKLAQLVREGHVEGWDDPRMPTICGLRRRGVPPAAIRKFADAVGVAKRENLVDIAMLEHLVREELNETAPRYMAVLHPLKVIIENYPEGREETFDAPLYPEDDRFGTRPLVFGRELYIDRDDFREDPPPKWHRLSPGAEIRLRYAYIIRCKQVVRDSQGNVTALMCTYDPDSRGGNPKDGRRVRGTCQWVHAGQAVPIEVRLYDRLFRVPDPDDVPEGGSFLDNLNPDSLTVVSTALAEPHVRSLRPEDRIQFERIGYFVADRRLFCADRPVFNRTVTLRDSWAKIEKKLAAQSKAPGCKEKDAAARSSAPEPGRISIDDFSKLALQVGKILEAYEVDGADKLVRLVVDVGAERPKQVFAGIRQHVDAVSDLVGRQGVFVTNLAPRKMRFGVSEAMMLVAGDDARISFLDVSQARPGDRVR